MTRALVTQLVEALEYAFTGNRRPEILGAAITKARAYLAAEPSGDRAELIARLAKQWAELDPADPYRADIGKAVDMLEADAQQATPYGWMVIGVPTVMRGSLAQEIQEQEAKRIGGTCKAFPVYTSPKQAKRVPMTDDQIQEIYIRTYNVGHHGRDFENAFARAIEAHHGIRSAA